MILGLVLAAIVASTSPSPVALSPQTQAMIAPVHDAIVQASAELAILPPPKDDAEKLIRMRKLD
jgi:hypothetical protein